VAGEKVRLMCENGNLDGGIISCGQGIGLVHDIPTVKELFDRIIGGASKIVKGFQEKAGKGT
jgi:NAD(P)H-dependent flavin oxidoreductase YrpB (nitropropane dioxygenase family)